MALIHAKVPISEVMHLIVNPGDARINSDNTHMLAVIDGDLHILIGDFTGIDSDDKLDEIIQRNL